MTMTRVEIPILFEAFPREKRDGRVLSADDYDKPVRILRMSMLHGLFNQAVRDRLNLEWNNAFRGMKSEDFEELVGLYVLAYAIKNKDGQLVRRYIARMAPV